MSFDKDHLQNTLIEATSLASSGRVAEAQTLFRHVLAVLGQASPPDLEIISTHPRMTEPGLDVAILDPPGLSMAMVFKEVAEALCFGLRSIGVPSDITSDVYSPRRRRILLGCGLLPNARRAGYTGTLGLRDDTILYQFEQVVDPAHFLTSSVLPWFTRLQAWDYSRHNLRQLHMAGLDAIKLVPLGFVSQWTRIPDRPKDVDVLFYGHRHPRRMRIIEALRRRNIKAYYLVDIFGEERDAWIARSKIVLNIHAYDAHVLEYPRVMYLLANHVCVVSESGNDPGEREFTEGVAFAPYAELVETCDRLLQSPTDRERIAVAGFDIIRRKPMAASLKAALGM